MALFNLSELCARLTRGQCLIGLDPGQRRIGVALSDVGLRIAGPYATLRRSKLARNAAEIAAIAQHEQAGGLVVGLPLSMDGSFGPAAQAARDWTLALSAAIALPAAMFDERLTTDTVLEMLGDQRTRHSTMVDQLAAAQILQGALDEARKEGRGALPPGPPLG